VEADRATIAADGRDLAFITVKVVDDQGTVVPDAHHLIQFALAGEGKIIGVDNGLQTSDEPFQASYRKAFNGLCLAVAQSTNAAGKMTVTARSTGLAEASVVITTR
jgi:beta-galactosidase